MKSIATYVSAWILAIGVAFLLAFAAPSESSVMGHLPAFMTQNLLRQPVSLPAGFASDRTLALITFKRGQRPQIDGWVQWVKSLNQSSATPVNWLRMTVVNDPGTDGGRQEVWTRLLDRYPGDDERANFVPVFTDHRSFVRATGFNGTDQVMAVVLNRQGDVLARAEGAFDADKAQSLLETLKSSAF
jgi:hypothetical protein